MLRLADDGTVLEGRQVETVEALQQTETEQPRRDIAERTFEFARKIVQL